MALEMRVYEELTAVDPKIMAGLTLRQMAVAAVWLIVGGGAVVAMWLVGMRQAISWVMVLIAIPGALYGWVKPFGLRFEVYATYVWAYRTRPRLRVYGNEAIWRSTTVKPTKGRALLFAKKLTASAKRTDPAAAPDHADASTVKPPRRARRLRARAQELCWYEALLPSGVMVLGGGKYSAMLKLADINYQMATEDRQRVLLERYARFFNSFSAGEQLQVTLINRRVARDQLLAKVLFPEPRHGDCTSVYRADHNKVVRDKIGSGHFSIVTEKYLTLTVSATSVEHAATALNRVSESVINHMWSLLECQAHRIDGAARVRLLRELTRGCYGDDFDYGGLAASGASTRDELAPASVDLSNPNQLVLHGDESEIFCQSLVMRNYPAWMSDTLFKKLSEVQANLVISFHVAPIDKGESRELVLRRKAMLDMEYTEKRRKLGKAGMDPVHDLPHELKRSMKEVEDLLDDIEQSDQRLFTTTLVVMVQAATAEELKERVDQIQQVAKAESCELAGLRFFQEQGFNTALPLGESFIPIHRTLDDGGGGGDGAVHVAGDPRRRWPVLRHQHLHR